MQVVELETLKNLYSIKMTNEVNAFDISHDLNRYAAGFSNGNISIKSRSLEDQDDEDRTKDQEDKDMELLEYLYNIKIVLLSTLREMW